MKKLSILIIFLFLTGCSISNESCQSDPFGGEYSTDKTDFKVVAKKGIDDIFSNIIEIPEYILITDFVDTDTLKGGTSLSFVLSNAYKDSLVNLNKFRVIEVELAKYFKIGNSGVKVLTRELKELLNSNLKSKYGLIGSYSATSHQLLIFLKLVNLESGMVEKSFMDTLEMSCEIKGLLKN